MKQYRVTSHLPLTGSRGVEVVAMAGQSAAAAVVDVVVDVVVVGAAFAVVDD